MLLAMVQLFFPVVIPDPLGLFSFKVADNHGFTFICQETSSKKMILDYQVARPHAFNTYGPNSAGITKIPLGTSNGGYVFYRFGIKKNYRYFGSLILCVSSPGYIDQEVSVPWKWIWIRNDTTVQVNFKIKDRGHTKKAPTVNWILVSIGVLGGMICIFNFHLSFIRCAIYKMKGKLNEYRWASGIPLFGSLFVGLSIFEFFDISWLLALSLFLILIDTGGVHWFLASMIWHAFPKRGTR